jgi:hypothetical protein
MLPSDPFTQEDAQTRSSAHTAETRVVRGLTRRRLHAHGHGRRRKSRPLRLPVDDDKESDGAQADEEPLAGSRAHTDGLANVDTRRRSAVVSTSRQSLVEDDEGRRHSILV